MSLGDPFFQIQELGLRFLRTMVETPINQLFGRVRRADPDVIAAAPGTLFIDPDAAPTTVSVRCIRDEGIEMLDPDDIESIRTRIENGERVWVDVAGFADDDRIRSIAETFDLHPMVLADLVNVDRQVKVSTLEGEALILLQVLHLDSGHDNPGIGQVGLLLRDNLLLSFRERPDELFGPLLNRLGRPTSRLRSQPLDYLACMLLDVAIDGAFPVVEALSDRVDAAEEEVMEARGHEMLAEIHRQRRALITLGRLFWRQRDLTTRLLRDDEIVRRETQIYLRDIHDRTVQLIDMVETTRELAAGLVEIHMSISAHRTNQIMKTLTIMASIFIPLTFIAGVYGMNFEWMPELTWQWGYPVVVGVMLTIGIGLLAWFWRHGWLGGGD